MIESYQSYIKNHKHYLKIKELDDAEITILVCYINLNEQKDFYFYGASSNSTLDEKINFDILKNTNNDKTLKSLISNKAKFITDIKQLLDLLIL
ncbi:hypothetical protein WFS19_00475 [Ureaplasma parvum]|nr:hypothetical protein [Ureaplasma parvum]